MNSVLTRAGSTLAKKAFKSQIPLRAFSTFNARLLDNSVARIERIKTIRKLNFESTKTLISTINRFYSSEKFTPAQIEEKVLEIIKNFDRVKENPAKPEVRSILH